MDIIITTWVKEIITENLIERYKFEQANEYTAILMDVEAQKMLKTIESWVDERFKVDVITSDALPYFNVIVKRKEK